MSLHATAPAASPAPGLLNRPSALPVLIALLGVLLVSAPNLLDPMIRFDDYPALFADPEGYWTKTKDEGRWFNYLWHLRSVTTPAWLNFALYQILSALLAGFLALAALRGTDNRVWFASVLALLIIVAPPSTLIALWFNTLLPGIALLALYAGLGLILPRRVHLALLVPFTVIGFMAYTTYPLLLLAITICNTRNRSVLGLIGLLALFTFSFALAVLCVYSLNLTVHGIFGIPVAEWRQATPAHDWDSLVHNLPLVAQAFGDFLTRTSFDFTPMIYFHLSLLALTTLVLLKRAPLEALYLHAGLFTGLTLMVVQVLKTGVVTPPRAFIFVWVFYAIIITRAAQILTVDQGLAGRMIRNAVLLILGSYLLQTFQQYTTYRHWQSDTRTLAETIRPIDASTLAISSDALNLPSARSAFIQDIRGLGFRMKQLTGKTITVCKEDATDCCTSSASCKQSITSGRMNGIQTLVLQQK